MYRNLTASRPNTSQAKKNRINARKRQRIVDSDDDDVIESVFLSNFFNMLS